MSGIVFTELDPAPDLAGHLARYWHLRVGDDVAPGHVHRVLPDGCMALVAVESGEGRHLALQGPHDTPQMIPVQPGQRYWGMRFWPDTGGLVLECDPLALAGRVVPASGHLADAAGALVDGLAGTLEADDVPAICDRALRLRVERAGTPDPAVRLAVLAINASCGAAPVTALAADAGISTRQLQRRFLRSTGLTLKKYARIRRLRGALMHLLEPPRRSWGTVAADLGFADQAHLAREFRRLAGASPGDIAEYVAGIAHEAVLP